jgi:hypothetical protein
LINNFNNIINIKLEDRAINPINLWNNTTEKIFKNLLAKNEFEVNNFKYVREEPSIFKSSGNYRTIFDPDKLDSYYTNDINKARGFNEPKIIIFRQKPNAKPYLDLEGDVGSGPETYYLTDNNKKHLENIYVLFNSDIFKLFRILSSTSQYLKNPNTIKLTPLLVDKILKYNDILELYNLSEKSIDSTLMLIDSKKKQTRKSKAKPEKGGTRKENKSKYKTRKLKKSFSGLFN